MKLSKIMKRAGAGVVFAASILGCGSSANDQGVSFTLEGFGQLTQSTTAGTAATCSTTLTNEVIAPLGTNKDGSSSETLTCLVLQNNEIAVSIRTERAEISYYVPGATIQPPTTSAPAFAYLAPAVASASGTPTSGGTSGSGTGTTTTSTSSSTTAVSSSNTIPSGTFPGVGSVISLPINIIPPEIASWLSLNRNQLPEPPFSMDIVVHVLGITTAGDQLQTNDGFLQAQVTNDFLINETAGSSGGTTTETPSATTTP